MSSVSITNGRDKSPNGAVGTWKTPWMAQREKMASAPAPSPAAKAARAAKLAADAVESRQRAELSRRRRLMIAPLGFSALTGFLRVLNQMRVLELFYPAGAVLVAAILYKRSPAHYLSFVV